MSKTPKEVTREDIQDAAQSLNYTNLIDIQSAKSAAKRSTQGKKTLSELDQWRLRGLPRILHERLSSEKVIYFTKPELCQLMEWKLLRGTWRPQLSNLIASNDESTIRKVSLRAYESIKPYLSSTLSSSSSLENAIKSTMTILCELRGVGPATASLIMSTFPNLNTDTGDEIPFLSDEAWWWCFGNGKKVEYTPKGYARFVDTIIEVARRIGCKPGEVERYGWTAICLTSSQISQSEKTPIKSEKKFKDNVVKSEKVVKSESLQKDKLETTTTKKRPLDTTVTPLMKTTDRSLRAQKRVKNESN